jgi:predicted enzyme related to lactoylglutathione lyase
MELPAVEFILYVADQRTSRDFYAAVLDQTPTLDTEGMTEFALGSACTLGLMPVVGIAGILGLDPGRWSDSALPPRSELYWRRTDANDLVHRAIRAGGRVISPMARRSWGEDVAYLADPDGHVLALARMPVDDDWQ